jgi:hypothetical protein
MQQTREKYENGLLTIRFIGPNLMSHGVNIYDLGTSLLGIQRLVNKAYLSINGDLMKGRYPKRTEREFLSLTIGERKRASDAFALIPMLNDPMTIQVMAKTLDWVISGVLGYGVGDVLDRLKKEKNEDRQLYIGSIHADVVNIVNRIDAAGGIREIEIGSPQLGKPTIAKFDSSSKEYINELSGEFFLGKRQNIQGGVYRLYPNSCMVTIRRQSSRKVNIYLSQDNFDLIRFGHHDDENILFTGRPRYKLGVEKAIITDFEADSVTFGLQ